MKFDRRIAIFISLLILLFWGISINRAFKVSYYFQSNVEVEIELSDSFLKISRTEFDPLSFSISGPSSYGFVWDYRYLGDPEVVDYRLFFPGLGSMHLPPQSSHDLLGRLTETDIYLPIWLFLLLWVGVVAIWSWFSRRRRLYLASEADVES